MRSHLKIVFFTFILILFSYCRHKTDLNIPSTQEEFIKVYVELQRLKERHPDQRILPLDSSRAIIHKYGFTREAYDSSYAYFNEKPERWEAFYKEVLDRLGEDENSQSSEPGK